MSIVQSPTPVPAPPGRLWLSLGMGLCILGPLLLVAQYGAKVLIVPWYLPALTTFGMVFVLWSIFVRHGVVRFVALGLVMLFAVVQWLFLGAMARLPSYEGPAKAGQPMPAFETILADGSEFTEKDLANGQASVLVFFRGRW